MEKANVLVKDGGGGGTTELDPTRVLSQVFQGGRGEQTVGRAQAF